MTILLLTTSNKKKAFKRLQQAALLLSLGLVPIGTANANPAHIACGWIQTASEAPNERGRYATCVHALASPVGRAWWLLQSGQIAAWRICSFLHASAAAQEISCSGRCGPSLPALRASADAHGSWASATASEKKSIT